MRPCNSEDFCSRVFFAIFDRTISQKILFRAVHQPAQQDRYDDTPEYNYQSCFCDVLHACVCLTKVHQVTTVLVKRSVTMACAWEIHHSISILNKNSENVVVAFGHNHICSITEKI